MTERNKTFLAVFLVTLPLWLGQQAPLHKALEDFFFNLELARNPHFLTAQAALETTFQESLPLRRPGSEPLELAASSALSVFVKTPSPHTKRSSAVGANQESKVLFEKDAQQRTGIASLSKLMGALVVARHIPLQEEITITREAVLEEEDFGQLAEGEAFVARDLLYPMLMESSNDASFAFALELGAANFVNLMNEQAHLLGLKDTFFVNHAGLDPDLAGPPLNESTAQDISQLTRHLKTYYSSVFEILGLKERPLYTTDGRFHHLMENTNQLLSSNGPLRSRDSEASWPTRVLAGKTGWTPQAKGALVLVLEGPRQKGYLVHVVLGSERRFADMRKLTDWVFNSWRF